MNLKEIATLGIFVLIVLVVVIVIDWLLCIALSKNKKYRDASDEEQMQCLKKMKEKGAKDKTKSDKEAKSS